MRVKKTEIRCSLGEPQTFWCLQDLPEGIACYWAAEDERRPQGESYVVKKARGKKTVRRFKTAAEAISHAKEWGCEQIAKASKRKATK